MLLEGGANPNAQNSDGRTPLHLCMPAGFSACVVHLYNAGAGKASFYSILSLLHPSPSSADQGARFADRSVRACASQYIVARSVASQVKVTLRPSIVAPFPASYSLASSDDTIKDRDGKTALDQTSEDFSPANL